MKKIALASAIALASITAAHAAPTVYGKVFATVDYDKTEYKDGSNKPDESPTKLNSNNSRIGFKGEDSLTDTTNLVYQLEYAIKPDDNSQQFTSRNTYIGLAHNTLGTLLAGRMDTPFKTSKGNVDVFNDNSSTLSIDNTGPAAFVNLGENRANNVVAYKSPTIVGMPLTFTAAVSLSENDVATCKEFTTLNTGTGTTKDSCGNPAGTRYSEKSINDQGYSASLAYDQNGLYAAAGYDNNIGVEDSAWRVAASVDTGKAFNAMSGLMLGALYQNADLFDTNEDAKTWLISGKYTIANTPWAVKAQYINTDFGNLDTQEVAAGAEYAFNKAAKGHIYAGKITRDNYKDDTIVGTGIEYKF